MTNKKLSQSAKILGMRGAGRVEGNPDTVPAARNGLCPRCQTHLCTHYDERKCPMCGYVDYGNVDLAWMTPEHRTKERRTNPGGYHIQTRGYFR